MAVGSGWRVTVDRWGLRLAKEEAICHLASSREGKATRKHEGPNHQPSEVLMTVLLDGWSCRVQASSSRIAECRRFALPMGS